MSDTSCIFCKIAAHEIPTEIVHENDRIVAFRDTDPKAPTHILLIPKEHIGSIADIAQAATHLAKTEGIDRSGWRLVTNVGPDAGQSVFHLHVHLLGGRPMQWPPG